MQVSGATVFVTGTNRGIGRAMVPALVAAGAATVYAATRRPDAIADLVAAGGGRVLPIALDVTVPAECEAAAAAAPDVSLLINNAGVNFNTPAIARPDTANAQTEMAVNYFGTLNVIRAFAPVLKANGGGAIVNMISILGLVNFPALGTYSASKAALQSLTQAVRGELFSQGTHVMGVYPGAVDTDMTAGLEMPKLTPDEVVTAIMDGLDRGAEDLIFGDMASGVADGLAADSKAVERNFAEMARQMMEG